MNKNMGEIKENLKTLNSKVDTISDTCEFLKSENESLKQQNEALGTKVKDLANHIDNIEGQSRRNNLIFHGLKGGVNESWDTSEHKVRNFICDELGIAAGETFDLERVHRLRLSGNRNDGPIIAKFTKFKDRETVINSARLTLAGRSQYRVAEDFTPRVRQARRVLGEKLMSARSSGQRASLKFDKLFIDNKIYKYDEVSQKAKCVGETSYRPPRAQTQTFSQMPTQEPPTASDNDTDTEPGGGASSDILL
ncbi:MAG: cell division protein ZapB [Sedimenticola sp.]